MILSIFAFIIGILLIILIHEYGHFLLARLCGVKVKRLSIGFGKPIWISKDKSGTEYVITLFPLGGYVKMLDEREGSVAEDEKSQAYNNQPLIKKTLILLAGPFFNFLLAFIILWIIFTVGLTMPVPTIGKVIENTPAAKAGIKANSEIIAVAGKLTDNWQDVALTFFSYYGDKGYLSITTVENNIEQNHQIYLEDWRIQPLHPHIYRSLGIIPWRPKDGLWPQNQLRTMQYPFYIAFLPAFKKTIQISQFNGVIIWKLVTGKLSLRILAGPISMFRGIALATGQGFIAYLLLISVLSVSIGLINLIPIPGLDGGHVLIACIEKMIAKPISIGVQVLLYRLGMIIIFILIAEALANDLLRL